MQKKHIIIDSRMRDFEKKYLRNEYEIIELERSEKVYSEICAHVDIFCVKINEKLIVEKSRYNEIKKVCSNVICGNEFVGEKYPDDVKYNVCQIGNNAVHNFKFTDRKILEVIGKEKINKIHISQGYSNCSIAVIDENSAIVTDKKIAENLERANINVLRLDYVPDIKLLDANGKFSQMHGFIGGAISRIGDKIIVFGDLKKIDKNGEIFKFIKKSNLEIVDFKRKRSHGLWRVYRILKIVIVFFFQ